MFKSILLASLTLTAVGSAQAQYNQGDLLAGFSSGTGNDLVVDLGSAVALTDGQTWNISSIISANSGLANLATIANDSWGVVGLTSGSYNASTSTIFATAQGLSIITLQNNVLDLNGFKFARTDVGTIGANNIGYTNGVLIGDGNVNYGYTAANDNQNGSWNQQTTGSIGWGGQFFNPNTKGVTSINFYAESSTAAPQTGTFTLSSGGILTFNVVQAATPPTITLNTPANSAVYAGYATIPLSATVVSNNNPIASVQFYSGSTLLATVATPPYTANWNYVAPGSYPAVKAQANYGSSLTVTSTVASVTVNALVAPVTSQPVKNANGYSFGFTGPVGQPYTILTSTNLASPLASWTVAITNVVFGATGSASFTNTMPSDLQRYYRVKSP